VSDRAGTIASFFSASVLIVLAGQCVYIGRWTKGIEDAQETAARAQMNQQGQIAQNRTDIDSLGKRLDDEQKERRLLQDEMEKMFQIGAYAPPLKWRHAPPKTGG